jgi:hypothetical protein
VSQAVISVEPGEGFLPRWGPELHIRERLGAEALRESCSKNPDAIEIGTY